MEPYDWLHRSPTPFRQWPWVTGIGPVPAQPSAPPSRRTARLTEEQMRRIVREELADLMPIDVPDTPPES